MQSQLLKSFQGDMGAGRASDLATGKIRDAAENELKAARGSLARRGVSGGGLEGNVEGSIRGETLRKEAGATSDIYQDAEARRNALGGAIAGQANADDASQRADRELALRQSDSEWQHVIAQNREAADALNQKIAILSSPLFGGGSGSVFGSGGGVMWS